LLLITLSFLQGKKKRKKREKVPMASCIISLYIVSICRYTTVGKDILSQIKTGDVIVSAKLVEGQDRLILPNES
jgi:hypothetical protein